jgi:hypothetical protein
VGHGRRRHDGRRLAPQLHHLSTGLASAVDDGAMIDIVFGKVVYNAIA